MKKLTIRLDDKLHKYLKLQCVEQDTSINEFITDLIKSNISLFNKQLAAAKDDSIESTPLEIHKALEYIKATMSYESLDIPEEILKIMTDNMMGKYTDDQARHMVLQKHGLV